ncbi:2-dehydropantoate 2-reductase [Cohnella lubricantis]|uniref:2-dehydropantoate 2-reductase n=1 Tax=Cohnella lubricantis TaxID=2163172 RepID=A0A841TBC9_9BACL|nr:2-dehydropantoate 2-reductase [Cohnella lubricantis]MBB6677339.1 2-dehydropantoate 2-reductase [Cohnella lubricantis]MBP2116849.1 2-dehydropantoate 2-reductase [Cohnella lubricantis]
MRETKIAVAGGGSLGLLLAGKLNAAGCPAELWTRTEDQARIIERDGITVIDGAGGADATTVNAAMTAAVKAVPLEKAAAPSGTAVLLAMKQTALTPSFVARLKHMLPEEHAIVAFCNGIGHFDKLQAGLPSAELAAAVTTEAARRSGPAEVAHTGKGQIWLGQAPLFAAIPPTYAKSPDHDRMQYIESRLIQAGFTVSMSNNMTERMLRKLLINAVINPLTALLRIRNGELTSTPERLSLMRQLYDETAGILREYGLKDGSHWDELLHVCARTASNHSSMLQDILAGRKTEIDAINGAVVSLAANLGRQAPWNDKITRMVKSISDG